ncbi:hypothetical protein FQN60_005224, partial [Etheostoma spectabile]
YITDIITVEESANYWEHPYGQPSAVCCHLLLWCFIFENEKEQQGGGSSYMEKEGFMRSLDLLHRSGVKLDCIITDRQPQIQKFLRERKITHFYDVWHVAK